MDRLQKHMLGGEERGKNGRSHSTVPSMQNECPPRTVSFLSTCNYLNKYVAGGFEEYVVDILTGA